MVETVSSGSSDIGTSSGPSVSGGPTHYFREAIRIARFDDDAIGRVAGDSRALKYGACVVAIAAILAYVPAHLLAPSPSEGASVGLGLAIGIPLVVLVQLLASAVQVGLIHGLAKLLLGATGRFVSLLRVLWLASVVSWLVIIPVVGSIVGGIWYLLITLVTFEDVDGLERLQALVLVVCIGALMFFVRTFIP
jgi:hypothetical protein